MSASEAPVWIRRPAVAGYFYPQDPGELAAAVDRLSRAAESLPREAATAVLVPHGSFAQSGAVIGTALGRVRIPRRCIILGPSHTGSWMPWSIMERGSYRTPLGDVPIASALADALRRRCTFLEADAWAQPGEHAIEVVLPFLQRLGPQDLAVVPVVMASEDALELRQMARALAEAVRMAEEPVLLIASTDLSHYESEATARVQDQRLLGAIAARDSSRLLQLVQDDGIRMCGCAAAACVLDAATELGADQVSIERSGSSVDAGGDPHSVIGYAGVIIR